MSYSPNGEGGMSKAISLLGKALGVAAAILGTPAVHNRIREPLFHYLSETWGPFAAKWLTWAMCGAEAIAFYALTALIFQAVVVGGITAAVSRRY
jgi:hypothetical protein